MQNNDTALSALTISLLLICFCSSLASASQSFRVKDGDTVSVKISARELTRIAIARDGRLDMVYGAAGLLEVQPDMDLGEVYIKPLPGAPSTMSFFARDETGGVYTIVATQSDIPSETIILEPAALRNKLLANQTDRSQPHVDRVKNLMKGMANHEEVEGFYREYVDQVVPLWHETKIRLRRYYESVDLVGEVFTIENLSSSVMAFHESEFMGFGSNVQATALEALTLEPGKKIELYVVRRLTGKED